MKKFLCSVLLLIGLVVPALADVNLYHTLFVDGATGSDTYSVRGDIRNPWKTLAGAKRAAATNDLIYVFPGTYADVDQSGATWYFSPGVTGISSNSSVTFLSLPAPQNTPTAGLQEYVDRLPKATGVAGIGGGELDLGPGFYYLSTNLWVPGKWPFKLHVKGAGDQSTFIIYTGPTNTGLVRCETNNAGAVTGLTNNINLEWEGCTLSYVTNSTNFIFALENVNFIKIHGNTLVNYECLTNGNGLYTLCFEGNAPTQVPATAGISLYWGNEPNNGQGTFDIYNNNFYGLACSFHNGGIRGSFHHNKVFNNGFYKSGGTKFGHTNAFTFDYTQYEGRAGITTGAAIVNESAGQLIVEANNFSYCGLVLYQDTPNNTLGNIGQPTILVGNTYESCQYRAATWDDGLAAIASFEMGVGGSPGSINDQNGFPLDVVVTNSATKVQPNGVVITSADVIGLKCFLSAGGNPAYVAVNGALAVTNGIIGVIDGSSATAGNVGGQLTQSRLRSAATAVTTATTLNVTASPLSLTAGDWDVVAVVGFNPAATTTITRLDAAISTTSATLPGTDTIAVPDAGGQVRAVIDQAASAAGGDVTLQIVRSRVSVSATTSYYLVAQSSFAVSTMTVYGSITARRAR